MSNFPPPPLPPGFLPPPASFAQKKKRRWPWVVAAVVIVVFVAGALGDDGDEASIRAAAPVTSTTEAVAVTSTTTPPTTERTTTTLSTSDQLGVWHAENGVIFDQLISGMEDVSTAAGIGSPTLLGEACRDFRNVIDEAKALPPIPEDTVNGHWQEALRLYSTGAASCIDGTALMDADLINTAAEYLMDGTEQINLATDALLAVGGV